MFCKSSESNLRGLPAPGLLFWTALWSLALLVAKLQVTQPQKTLNMRWLSLLFLGFELVASARAAFAADYQESAASHLTRRHLELMQKRSREMAERAEMVAKGLIPSASLPSLRVRKIA